MLERAGGGSSKDSWKALSLPSRPLISVEGAGVGGKLGRGMAVSEDFIVICHSVVVACAISFGVVPSR